MLLVILPFALTVELPLKYHDLVSSVRPRVQRWHRLPTIDIDGLRFDYADTGRGIPVVFVAGLCGSKEWFCYQSAGLSDHFRVIACGLRRARGPDYPLDLLVDDLAKLLSALRIHAAAVAGYSLGGLVALRFAICHADRCLALVLASTAPSFASLSEEEIESTMMLGELRPESPWVRLWRSIVGFKEPRQDLSDPLAHLARQNGGIDRATLNARIKLMRETDLRLQLGEVEAPVLVIAGSREEPCILAGSQILDQELPDSSLEVIEDADQFHFCLRHDLFNAAVADFLCTKIKRL